MLANQEPEYIDIHAHVNFSAYDEDREQVIDRALNAGVWMINVGTQIDTSRDAVALAEKYPVGVYACIGLHPVHTSASHHDTKEFGANGVEFVTHGEVFDIEAYRTLAAHPKVVALGECGLDYYRLDQNTRTRQLDVFEAHIKLAQTLQKPLMLHIRNGTTPESSRHNAYEDALVLLEKYPGIRGNVHFFAGSVEIAQRFNALGFTVSFTGVITFTHDYDEVVRAVPLNMLLSETDCPYITPIPHRGTRNEPLYVTEVAKKIATIKGLPVQDVSRQLVINARRVFGI